MTNIADVAESTLAARPETPVSSHREAWNADAGFYLTMSVVSAVIIFAGFAPSFYLKSVIHAPPPLSFLTVTHGLVFTAWMILFVTQAALIAAGRPAPHRQLGIIGAILFGAMISLAISTSITAGRLGHAPPGAPPPLTFMALPLMAITATTALVGAALWNRRRPDWHKRLMLASVFTLTGPATGRIAIPLGFASQATPILLAGVDLLLVIAMAKDLLGRKRIHPAYLTAAAVIVVLHVGVFWAYGSGGWLSFAKAITRGA